MKSLSCNDDRRKIAKTNFQYFPRKKFFHFRGTLKVKKILESYLKKSMKSISCNWWWEWGANR